MNPKMQIIVGFILLGLAAIVLGAVAGALALALALALIGGTMVGAGMAKLRRRR